MKNENAHPRRRRSYERRKANTGRMFISIWAVGIVLLFVMPLVRTVIYSLNTLDLHTMSTRPAGLSYYLRLFTGDTVFVQDLTAALTDLLYQVPIVVMFSLFIAVLLNREFPGRLFFRAVFFLPVVVMSGVVYSILKVYAHSTEIVNSAAGAVDAFNELGALQDLLGSFGAGEKLIGFMSGVVSRVLDTVWQSGVQILLFLAGLQSVSPALYEAARMEGATKWAGLWKITFPMLSPGLLVSVIYTVIDSFTAESNAVIGYIKEVSFHNFEYSYGCAMSLTYCAVILLSIGLVALLMRRAFRMG